MKIRLGLVIPSIALVAALIALGLVVLPRIQKASAEVEVTLDEGTPSEIATGTDVELLRFEVSIRNEEVTMKNMQLRSPWVFTNLKLFEGGILVEKEPYSRQFLRSYLIEQQPYPTQFLRYSSVTLRPGTHWFSISGDVHRTGYAQLSVDCNFQSPKGNPLEVQGKPLKAKLTIKEK